jgi:hypothetical protein
VQSFSEVFFINASNVETMSASLKDIATTKGAGDSDDGALQWLAYHPRKWMLLLDNADDPGVNLCNYFPRCMHGNILIMSRNQAIWQYAPQSNYEVYGMSLQDAKGLLLNIVGIDLLDGEEEYATTIVKVY